jgi:hypothetical protein
MMTIDRPDDVLHISVRQHVRRRTVELGCSFDSRIPIYLDLNFWIRLRGAFLGTDAPAHTNELLDRLRVAVAAGEVFCPISDGTFCELLKQTDPASRAATASLIDELSLGVTLLVEDMRVETELSHFLHSFLPGGSSLYPLCHLVWSKVAYVFGVTHPTSTPFDPAIERVIQQRFFDHMWEIPLARIVETLGDHLPRDDLDLGGIARKLNAGNSKHAALIRSFQQTLRDELRGVSDLCADKAVEVLSTMAAEHGEVPARQGSPEWRDLRNMAANILFHALHSRPATRKQLPTLYIEACLHAAFRWNKTRQFAANDLYDIHHAAAALGYCRAFFTESPLRTVITSNHLRLDEQFDCAVVSDVPAALAVLQTLRLPSNAAGTVSPFGRAPQRQRV